jgi:hypothetical protein
MGFILSDVGPFFSGILDESVTSLVEDSRDWELEPHA